MIRLVENKIAVAPIFDSDKHKVPNTNIELIIPDEAKERCDQGIVRWTGPEVKDIQIGDYVLFSGYTGTLVRLEGEGLFIILREDFVTAIIDPPDTEIPGVYFRDKSGEYWTATWEMITQLAAQHFQETQPVKDVKSFGKEKPARAGA